MIPTLGRWRPEDSELEVSPELLSKLPSQKKTFEPLLSLGRFDGIGEGRAKCHGEVWSLSLKLGGKGAGLC